MDKQSLDHTRSEDPSGRAQACIAEARREFDSGKHALAIERLESFTPYNSKVVQAARDFRSEWEGIKQKRAHVDELIQKANREMEDGSFAVAIGLLIEAGGIDPSRQSVQTMLATAERAKIKSEKAEQTRSAWRQELDKVEEKMNARDFDTARKMVKELSQKRSNRGDLAKLSERIDDVEASVGSLASAQSSFDAQDFEAAITYADRALLLNPNLEEALELKRKAIKALPKES
jgi:tetratricopeptide (TPR) repeat protein